MARDRRLQDRAADMRHEATSFEVILWRHLSRSKLGGYKFRRQDVVDGVIVDFFCPAKGLIVEVDGDTHDAVVDAERDKNILVNHGFTALRFTNADVATNIEGVLRIVLSTLNGLPDRWGSRRHPNPSSKEEGL